MTSVQDSCPEALSGVSSSLFLALINTLMTGKCSLDQTGIYPEDYSYKLKDKDSFDFIIVGAGSAGSVVANRLSENPEWRVLVLEAGGIPSSTSQVPGLVLELIRTQEDWQYNSINPNACLGFINQTCYFPRGKCLGGSSNLNGMLYVRGNKENFNTWERMGNPGWGWENVLKYYIKSENVTDEQFFGSSLHGRGGYLTTSTYKSERRVRDIILNGARSLSIPITQDETNNGFYETLMTMENGQRCSSSKAFISKIRNKRVNLYISLNSQVASLDYNFLTKSTDSLKVRVGTKTLTIKAKKEIILSAGAINSPQILLNSGIGPKEDLLKWRILPVQDLPVGKNLQDHVLFPFCIKLNDTATDPSHSQLDDIYEYFTRFTGILSQGDTFNILGFVNTFENGTYPNIEYQNFFIPRRNVQGITNFVNYNGYSEPAASSIIGAINDSNLLVFLPSLLQPKSRGFITLSSSSPFSKPTIYSNYLSDPNGEDIQVLLSSVRFLERLIATPPFAAAGAQIFYFDNNCQQKKGSSEYWECYFRNFASTNYHPVGTAKMGARNDLTAVVSPRLKVNGINKLRVVDASIMPVIVSGNTNAPTILIGEKASDIIKEDYGFPTENL